VGEAEQVERPRSTLVVTDAVGSLERHQPGLVGMQCQTILAESLRQNREESLRISLALEQHGEVIGVPHHLGGTVEGRPDIPDEPIVEHFMQVDVRKER
jgi:hypothetical protein